MSILRISAKGSGLRVHRVAPTADAAFDRALAEAATGPIIVMIHGYKYAPGAGKKCPHRSIFSTDAARGTQAWPRHLGFDRGAAGAGLAIAFGWEARNPLLHTVYRGARAAGAALAVALGSLHERQPERKIHFLTHSLGSEVAFEAVSALPAGSVGRIICLTGASYRSTALDALASPAGQTAELVNVASRENDVFDFLFERLVKPPVPGDRAIGHGLAGPNIATLQIDHPAHLDALAGLALEIGPARRRVCHWSAYTRPGALRAWAELLRRPEAYPLAALAPSPPTPRWSRLVSGFRPALSLPALDGPSDLPTDSSKVADGV